MAAYPDLRIRHGLSGEHGHDIVEIHIFENALTLFFHAVLVEADPVVHGAGVEKDHAREQVLVERVAHLGTPVIVRP